MCGVLAIALAAIPCAAPAGQAALPDLGLGAAVDLELLERPGSGSEDAAGALASRLEAGIAEVRRATLAQNRDSDPLLEAPTPQNAALLLRLHTLEALAAACGRDLDGIRFAAHSESLEAALRLQMDELRPDATSLLPVAAGLRLSSREAERILPALEAVWQQHCGANRERLDGATAYLLLHTFPASQVPELARMWRPAAADAWDAAIAGLGSSSNVNAGRVVAVDDPVRQIHMAARLLVTSGVVAASRVQAPLEALGTKIETPQDHAKVAIALDSLAAALGDDVPRASPILGSRHDYYRRRGAQAPSLHPSEETLARVVGRNAVARLAALLDRQVLERLGMRASAEVEPVEIVPGQQLAAAWTLEAATAARFVSRQASVGGMVASVRDPQVEIAAGARALVRTGFVSLQRAATGTVLAVDLALAGSIDGWGHVVLRDRVTARVVAPVQASLLPVGDPLLDGGRKGIEAIVTSRAPHPVRGTVRVLATSDWKIEPARQFRFTLLRPGQSARTRIDVEMPPLASPGPYDFLVRLEVDDQPVGTLGTRLVRPVEWVVVGPFAPPRAGRALPPEKGASLAARYTGAHGRQIAWRVAPRDAYDPDGGLDLEALFPETTEPVAACALTVVESPEVTPAVLRLDGAVAASWNGKLVPADGRVRVESGRNTLLVRTRSTSDGWRLQVELRDESGAPLRVLANDLARLLDGYADLERSPRTGPSGQPPDRIVVVAFTGPAPATEVAVLGSFNAWVPLGLERQADGSWRRELRLAPGRYAYKLLVDGLLRPDPAASTSEPDGFGGRNSLLIVH